MNKRAHIRHHVTMPARLILGDEPERPCQVQDFCLGGMLLDLPEPGLPRPAGLGVDTSIRLALDVQGLRGMRRVVLPARVRRQAGNAVGVAFDRPDSKDLLAVQSHVRALIQKERCGTQIPDHGHGHPARAREPVRAGGKAQRASTAPAPTPFPGISLRRAAWRLTQRRHVSGEPSIEPEDLTQALRETLAQTLVSLQRSGLEGQELPDAVARVVQAAGLKQAPLVRVQAELVRSLLGFALENPLLGEAAREAILGFQVTLLRILLLHEPIPGQPAGVATRLIDLMVALGIRGRIADLANTAEVLSRSNLNRISQLHSIINNLDEVISRDAELYEARVAALVSRCRIREERDRADSWIGEELEARLCHRPIPTVILTLINAGWRQLLAHAVRREGAHGPAVRDALDVIEQLAQALDRVPTRNELSALLERIKHGLVLVDRRQLLNDRLIPSLRDLLSRKARDSGEPETVILPSGTFRKPAPRARDESAFRRFAEKVSRGDWFVLEQKPGRRVLRFAWMSTSGQYAVFTDAAGEDPVEFDQATLTDALQRNALTHVPGQDESTVSRALDMTVERLYQELSHSARHDPVTGLLTRAELERRLSADGIVRGTLVWIDPGHEAVEGQRTGRHAGLRHVAATLKTMFRNRLAARADAHAFMLWLPETGLVAAQTAVEAFRRRLAAIRSGQGFTPAFGLTERQPNQSVTSLLQGARQACRAAKSAGQSQQVSVSASPRDESASPLVTGDTRIVLQSRHAEPATNGLRPACCIDVRLRDGRARPTALPISPLHYSQMHAFDRRVVTNLLRWIEANAPIAQRYDYFLLRLSRLSLRDGGLPDFLREQFHRYSVHPRLVCLEFDETDVSEDFEIARRRIPALREVGTRVALGGFGLAAIPIAELRMLEPELLNLDEALVATARTRHSLALIQGITDIAALIGSRTLARHIPDVATRARLREAGVDWTERHARGAKESASTAEELSLSAGPTEKSC